MNTLPKIEVQKQTSFSGVYELVDDKWIPKWIAVEKYTISDNVYIDQDGCRKIHPTIFADVLEAKQAIQRMEQ